MHDDSRARGIALMQEAEIAIVDGVERLGADWVARTVVRVADDAALETQAREAGVRAAARVVSELRALFALPPEEQRVTPLQIVRTLRNEASEVLAAAGVPPTLRDPFEERAFPDDVYGIVPRALSDLGEDDLGPLLMAWGMGKSMAMRGAS